MFKVIRQRLHASIAPSVELARDERGASFIEYVIVAGLVAIAAIGAFNLFGTAIQTQIGNETTAINNMGGGAAP